MARSTATIFNAMVAEKNSFANLGGLIQTNAYLTPLTPDNPFNSLLNQINSMSVVAVWLLFIYLVADAMNQQETLWDNQVAQVNQQAAAAVVCNLPWYESIMQQWQSGYSLAWNAATRRAFYPDTTSANAVAARLLDPVNGGRVSVNEVTNANYDGVVVKVAKSDGNGGLTQLDTTPGGEADEAAFYINRQKPAGVQTSVVNLPADLLKLDMILYYDGQLPLATFQASANAAIEAFMAGETLNNITGIDFDGIFGVNDFVKAMMAIPGSKEPGVLINSIQALPAGGVYQIIVSQYNPASGYFVLDNTSQITYQAV